MSAQEPKDFNALAERARQLQGAMSSMTSDMKNLEATGVGGGGLITATVSGEGRVLRLQIDPSVIDPRDPQTLAELIIAAVDGAHDSLEKQRSERLTPITGGLQDIVQRLHLPDDEVDQHMPQPPTRRRPNLPGLFPPPSGRAGSAGP
jgi:nucleoid-associated protein EbfC